MKPIREIVLFTDRGVVISGGPRLPRFMVRFWHWLTKPL
jgi:hypothetical protein